MATRADDVLIADAYVAHAAEVYRVIRGIVANRTAAEDLTHDTFLKAQQNLSRFDRKRPVRPWLLTIAIRTALDYERRERIKRVVLRREERTFQMSDSEAIDRRIDMGAALSLLEPKQRAVVVARHYADMDYKEIGAALGITANNVGVILHRSHLRLRESLAGSGGATETRRHKGPSDTYEVNRR